jgi:hypothetical protein
MRGAVGRFSKLGPFCPYSPYFPPAYSGISLRGMPPRGRHALAGGWISLHTVADVAGLHLSGRSGEIGLAVLANSSDFFSGHCGKSRKQIGLFLYPGKHLRLCRSSDIISCSQGSIRPGTFRVHPSFGNDYPVEMSRFFQKPDALQQRRASWAGRHGVLVVHVLEKAQQVLSAHRIFQIRKITIK